MANRSGASNYILLLVSALVCLMIVIATISSIFIPGLWVIPFSVAWFAPGALIYQLKEMIAVFLVIGIVLLAGLIYVIYPSRHSTNISKGTVIMALFLFTIIACLGLFLASMGAFGK